MRKTFKQIINESTKKTAEITDLQVGGPEGRATTDHLLILKDIVKNTIDDKKKSVAAFLDITKCQGSTRWCPLCHTTLMDEIAGKIHERKIGDKVMGDTLTGCLL